MFDVLAKSHYFTHQSELLFDGLVWRDFSGCSIGTEKVPGVESGKVLEGSEKLIATDGCSDEFKVMCDGWMVNHSIGDHLDDPSYEFKREKECINREERDVRL